MKSYFDHQPQERATLTEEQIEQSIEIELMLAGVVVPKQPRHRKRPEDISLHREPVYSVKVGHTDLQIAFRTAEEAQKFLELRPLFVTTDYETYTKHTATMDRAVTALELLPDEDAVTAKKEELRRAHKERSTIENEARAYSTKLREVEKIREKVLDDWREQQDKFSDLGDVKLAYSDYARLAGGNKDLALACLRKTFGEDVVLEAATWLDLPELARALPSDVKAEAEAAKQPDRRLEPADDIAF